ncbi:pulmonary surfactant-associated protein B [Discoglossus pictus]
MERTQVIWVYALCVIAGVSANVLGKDECAEGPQYWCQDLATAIQCGAVQHCKQTVWKEHEDTICQQCQQIITIMMNMVKTSVIQDTIKKFLHKECDYLSVGPLVDKCHMLVDQYESVLVTLLENQINPAAICTTLTFCNADQSAEWNPESIANHIIEKVIPLVQENLYNIHSKATQEQDLKGDLPIPMPLCWMCKNFIGRIEAVLPKEIIAKSAAKVCLFLPSKIAGVCQCLIERYTVIILDFLLAKLGPQLVCGLLYMCVTEENCAAGLPVIPVVSSDVPCHTCLTVTSFVKPTMDANLTQVQIESALLRVCANPAMDWKQCHGFLEVYQTELVQVLHKPWDHRMTCQEVGACPAEAKPAQKNSGCAAGPLYWCKSLDTAKECEAVGHCLKHVWL